MLADLALRSFQRWFMSSSLCCRNTASSELPRAFTILNLLPSTLLNTSLWASISAWISYTHTNTRLNSQATDTIRPVLANFLLLYIHRIINIYYNTYCPSLSSSSLLLFLLYSRFITCTFYKAVLCIL